MIKETGKIVKEVARVCDFCESNHEPLNYSFKSICNICQKDLCDKHLMGIGEYSFCPECTKKYETVISDAAYANLLDTELENFITNEQVKVDKLRDSVWDQINALRKALKN